MATRKANGQRERDIEQAKLDTEAAELRVLRLSYPEIARRQNCSVSTAYDRVKRAIAAVPYEAIEELRRVELESLDELEQRAREVLLAEHVKVDHGKVIEIDGVKLLDDGPVLNAITSILRIKDMRAKLTGEYAPVKVESDVRHSVQSDLDREIAGLMAKLVGVGESPTPVAPDGAANPTHT